MTQNISSPLCAKDQFFLHKFNETDPNFYCYKIYATKICPSEFCTLKSWEPAWKGKYVEKLRASLEREYCKGSKGGGFSQQLFYRFFFHRPLCTFSRRVVNKGPVSASPPRRRRPLLLSGPWPTRCRGGGKNELFGEICGRSESADITRNKCENYAVIFKYHPKPGVARGVLLLPVPRPWPWILCHLA